jgi:hypothetical protein
MPSSVPPSVREHPPLLTIGGLSGAALALEILLLRLLAIVHWYHFAYLVISIALLGYGISGTLVALGRDPLVRHWRQVLVASAVGFALAVPVAFLLVQQVPFNALEVAWSPRPWLHLGGIALLLTGPFLCAATGLAVCLAAFPRRVSRVYAADLWGAGVGAIAVLALLHWLTPLETLQAITAVGWLAAAGALRCLPRAGKVAAGAAVIAALVLGLFPWPVSLVMTPYKPLALALRVPDSRMIWESSHPMGLVSVVESPGIPFHFAPGLGLQHLGELPEQLGVFRDGEGFEALNRYRGDLAELAFLGATPSAAAFHLAPRDARVAVLGAGAGTAALQALFFEAQGVTAVERHPAYQHILQEPFREFAGWEHLAPRLQWVVDDPRGYLETHDQPYDVIQLPLAGGGGGFSPASLEADYTLTEEALATYWEGLAPGGVLAFSRWIALPPRDELRLAHLVIQMLESRGLEAGAHLAMLRGWSSATILVKKGGLTGGDVERLRAFCRHQGFDPVYWPGIRDDEVNRFNRMAAPLLHQGVLALLGPGRAGFLERYKFAIDTVSDDRPFFGQFFRWRTLPELLALIPRGGAGLMEWGYPVLLITLGLSAVLSVGLILLPLAAGRGLPAAGGRAVEAVVYFGCLGLGFLSLEIAAIHQLTRLLHHPVYAAAAAVGTFLLGAGAGSAWVREASRTSRGARSRVPVVVGLIAAAALGLPAVIDALAAGAARGGPWPWLLAAGGLCPLAFLLGMPFPLGLAAMAQRDPRGIPWAWCINGCASVLAGPLSTLLAMEWGFTRLRLAAVGFYGLAGLVYLRLAPR